MKIRIEDWDESLLDVEDYQVERAATRAALDAIQRAESCGTSYVVWESGHVKSVRAGEAQPYKERLHKNLDRLTRKIAELQAQQPNALALNDKPKENS